MIELAHSIYQSSLLWFNAIIVVDSNTLLSFTLKLSRLIFFLSLSTSPSILLVYTYILLSTQMFLLFCWCWCCKTRFIDRNVATMLLLLLFWRNLLLWICCQHPHEVNYRCCPSTWDNNIILHISQRLMLKAWDIAQISRQYLKRLDESKSFS